MTRASTTTRYAAPGHRPTGRPTAGGSTRLTAPSRLFGANGLRTGPDGRIYIAQVTGSQISALDIATGEVETVSAKGGDIIAPDDVAFDAGGNLYATEVMDGRVSVRDTDGRTRVLRDDVPVRQRHHRPSGPAVHQRVPRRRPADGARPQRRRAARPAGEPAARPTRWRSAPTGCSTSR